MSTDQPSGEYGQHQNQQPSQEQPPDAPPPMPQQEPSYPPPPPMQPYEAPPPAPHPPQYAPTPPMQPQYAPPPMQQQYAAPPVMQEQAGVPAQGYDWTITLILSILLGELGVDRFYTGSILLGILKLITFGGCGIWWIVDIILIVTGSYKDAQGRPLVRKL